MASISSIGSISALPLDQLSIRKLSPEEIAEMKELQRKASLPPPTHIKPDNDPSNLYAEVRVNGEVVAKIYNSGCVETSNAIGAKLRAMLADDVGSGPSLAKERAAAIAEKLGGEVVTAPTAQTQSAWSVEKSAQLLALQEYYEGGTTTPASMTEAVKEPTAADRFLKLIGETPEQRLRNLFLAQLGLTEEDLKTMSPEERAKVEKKLAELIKEKIKEGTGISDAAPTDILA